MITKDFMTDTKIVGVSQFNDKGVPIQIILSNLKSGQRLAFLRDYGNKYDNNAIKAFSWDGHELIHIGYISKELAAEIAPFLDKNTSCDLEGVIHEITGGVDDKVYGCNIRIWIQSPNEPTYEDIKSFQKEYHKQNHHQTANQHSKNKSHNLKHISIALLSIIITVLLLITIGTIYDSNNTSSVSNDFEEIVDKRLITLNEYHRLRIGMSRGEVYNIVGSYGEKISESSTDGYRVTMYSYDGYGSTGANAQLMFENGRLSTMAQYGLDYYWDDISSEEAASVVTSSTNTPNNETSVSSVVSSTHNNETPVKIENLHYDITILPPNSIGTVWMEATYTNNSSYVIKSFSLTILLKDKNEKTYLSCYDTVLPGETSSIFNSFGPTSMLSDDIEILKCSLRAIDENGDNMFIDYDYKTETYDVLK